MVTMRATGKAREDMFSLRIVNLEYYTAPPLPGMDVCYSKFQGRTVMEVPVIRVYGSTPAGQKSCLHVHQVFPYFYVPYDEDLSQDISDALAYMRCLASAIEKAMKLANSSAAKKQHVHGCSLVRARRYYGYYPCEQLFIKIVLYHPQEVGRISSLLQGGGIMNRKFQPHEAHIPYLLQFLIDQNLSGMSHLHLSNLKFRQPIPERPSETAHIIQQLKAEFVKIPQRALGEEASTSNATGAQGTGQNDEVPTVEITVPSHNEKSASGAHGSHQSQLWVGSSIHSHWLWPSHYSTGGPFGRHSTCELEADASVEDILNRHELLFMPLQKAGPAIKLVQSLTPMWEEERLRTGEDGPAAAMTALKPSAERFPPPHSSLERALRDSLFEILNDEERLHVKTDPLVMSTQEMLLECSQAANTLKRHTDGQDEMKPRLDTRSIGVQDWPENNEEGDQGAENPSFGLHGELLDEHIVRSQLTQQQGRFSQDTENEVAELLGWMGGSQVDREVDEECSEDDEEETVGHQAGGFSQVWGSPSMEAAMLQALTEFEHPTQKECREILDCVNNSQDEEDEENEEDRDDDGLLEAALHDDDMAYEDNVDTGTQRGHKHEHGLQWTIPQVDGADDDLYDYGNSSDHNVSKNRENGDACEDSPFAVVQREKSARNHQQFQFTIPQSDGAGDDQTDSDSSRELKRMRVSFKEAKRGNKKEDEKDIGKRSGWGLLPIIGVSSQFTDESQGLKEDEDSSGKQAVKLEGAQHKLGICQRQKDANRIGDFGGFEHQRSKISDDKKRSSEVSLRAMMRKQRERQLRQKESSPSGDRSIVESHSEGEHSVVAENSETKEELMNKREPPHLGWKILLKQKDREKMLRNVTHNQASPLLRDSKHIAKFGILPIVNRDVELGAISSPPKEHLKKPSSSGGMIAPHLETGLGQFVDDEISEPKSENTLQDIEVQEKDQNTSVRLGSNLLDSGDHRDCGGGKSQEGNNNLKEAVQLTLGKEYEDLFLASTDYGLKDENILNQDIQGSKGTSAQDVHRGGLMTTSVREKTGVVQDMQIVITDVNDHGVVNRTTECRHYLSSLKVAVDERDVSSRLHSLERPNFTRNGGCDFEHSISEDHFVGEEAGPSTKHEEVILDLGKSQGGNFGEGTQMKDLNEEIEAIEPNNLVEEQQELINNFVQYNSSLNIAEDVNLVNVVPDVDKGILPEKNDMSFKEPISMYAGDVKSELDNNDEEGNKGTTLVFTDMSDESGDSFDWGDEFGSFHKLDESDEAAEHSEDEIAWSPLPDEPSEILALAGTGGRSKVETLLPHAENYVEDVAPMYEDNGASPEKVVQKILRDLSGAMSKAGMEIDMRDTEGSEVQQKAPSNGLQSRELSAGVGKVVTETHIGYIKDDPKISMSPLSRSDAPEDEIHSVRLHNNEPESTGADEKSILLLKAKHTSLPEEFHEREPVGALTNITYDRAYGKQLTSLLKVDNAHGIMSDNLITLKFHQKPPSREALVASFGQCGLRGVDYGGVFYGNSKDVPAQPTISAGLVFDVKSKEAEELPPFTFGAECSKSSFSTRRLEQKKKHSPVDAVLGVPCHYRNDGNVSYLLTPARAPPSRLSVQNWLLETPDGNDQNYSSVRGERVFTMDANTGKLVPIGDLGTNRDSQDSLTMRDTSDEGVDLLRPASPKYDEKHVLATSDFTNLSCSPAYALSRKKVSTVPLSVPALSKPGQLTSKETTPVNSQSSEEVIPGQPNPSNRKPQSKPMDCTPPQPPERGLELHVELKKEALKEKQPVGRPSKEVLKSRLLWRDISQVTAPSPDKGQLTPLSQSGFRDPASVGAGQQVTMISIEVHSESRGNLRPDPRYDAIGMVVVVIQYDSESQGQINNQTVVLIVDAKAASSTRNIDGVVGCNIIYLPEELTLLKCFVRLVVLFDPDIMVGWEIQGYSLGLLAERAANLGFGLLKELSRTPPKRPSSNSDNDKSVDVNNHDNTSDDALPKVQDLRSSIFGDKIPLETVGVNDSVITDEWGRTHGSGLFVGGRIILNLWRIMRGEVKLGIYTLEAVAEAVLRRRVPRIPWRILSKWFSRGPAGGRFRCIEYFIERAQVNFQIMDQLDLLNRTAELARVFGIDFYSVFSRGSQYRVESMMLRLAHTQNFLLISPSRQQVAGQPAMACLPLVMEPESRFYTCPVVVLDFQSLYPSMIIAYNLCFSTCLGKIVSSNPKVLGVTNLALRPGLLKELKDCLTITPNGIMYTPKEVCQGVVPRLLSEILSTRIMVKQAMKNLSPDQRVLQRVLNARQFALKLIANVTYGYTAAGFSGRMPCAELADSIVQCGRLTLERAIHLVNTEKRWDARVVYGDTDSMFVQLEGRTREEAFKIGQEIAAAVTAMNPTPVTLKMEKVYHPCVLLTKKRYVGYSYESPGQEKPIFDAKGIETIRRDSCPAVAKTLERSLRTLFETQDLSQVKEYLQRQWGKIVSGRVSLRDFIFAKEVRLGTYSARASVLPAAAIVASKAMSLDPRAEPRYAERVPYVVVHGEPGARLSDVVVDPRVMLANNLRLHDTYYITKQIIPALQRVFGLVGADLRQWYAELPRVYRPPTSKRVGKVTLDPPNASERGGSKMGGVIKGTIDHYYLSQHCSVCGELMRGSQLICTSCSANPQAVMSVMTTQTSRLEKEFKHLEAICRHCGGADGGQEGHVACVSLDCPIFFERLKVKKELQSLSTVSAKCGSYPTCLLDFGSELF